MDRIKNWRDDLSVSLEALGIDAQLTNHQSFKLLSVTPRTILNLLSLGEEVSSSQLIALQEGYQERGIQVIHLWEDVWITRRSQVLSRIKSFLGLNQRVYARNTTVCKIIRLEAEPFIEANHLQGYVNARHAFALFHQETIIAVATFSNKRRMKEKGEDYYSAELIRFATKQGITVTGGLSKLIKHYLDTYKPNDLMSYADRDWSLGTGYLSAGFTLVGHTPPQQIYVQPETYQRFFPDKRTSLPLWGSTTFVKVTNSGNLKYIRIR